MNLTPRWLLVFLVVALAACDDLRIDDGTNEFLSETPCGAVEAGQCTWVGDTCVFTAMELDFCGETTALDTDGNEITR